MATVSMVGCSKQTGKARAGTGSVHVRFCFIRNCDSIACHFVDKHKLALDNGWNVRTGSRENFSWKLLLGEPAASWTKYERRR
jgi:hypothetical protein